ncbi:DUF6404 family protein [Escherichia coli]
MCVSRLVCTGLTKFNRDKIVFGLLMAFFHWWRRKVNRLPPWDDV